MSDTESTDELTGIIRSLRQRLDSLRRGGLDRIPVNLPAILSVVKPVSSVEVVSPTPETPRLLSRPSAALLPPVPPVKAASLFEEPEITAPAVPPSERLALLSELAQEVSHCVRCPILVANRSRTVFSDGSPIARLMFVGEAPGADEDRTGVPFVGKAGMLLTDMITKGMGLERSEVYIANVIKSRPPDNRPPEPDEIANCLPYLVRQIEIVRPEFLCLLGKTAAMALLETALAVGRLRGRWHRYRGIPAIVTYHPSYLLRQPSAKKEAWEDLQMLMRAMGLNPPGRSR